MATPLFDEMNLVCGLDEITCSDLAMNNFMDEMMKSRREIYEIARRRRVAKSAIRGKMCKIQMSRPGRNWK